ncbi:hypothetical protein D3C79_1112960 [compost metagenome]
MHDLIDIAPAGGHASRIEWCEAGEIVAIVKLGVECASEHLCVGILKIHQCVLDLVLLVE